MSEEIENIATLSTEEKIKKAAEKVFVEKGFKGTRTRDIAEEAGINLALLHYYYRSKEKLFELIMIEKFQQFFGVIAPILNDYQTSLDTKIEQIAEKYIDFLIQNPDLPIFIFNEIRNTNASESFFVKLFPDIIKSTFILQQLRERNASINPLQLMLNLIGMLVIPFAIKPILLSTFQNNEEQYSAFVQERKKLIPIWMKTLLDTEI